MIPSGRKLVNRVVSIAVPRSKPPCLNRPQKYSENLYSFFTGFAITLHTVVLTMALLVVNVVFFCKGGSMIAIYILLTVIFFVGSIALVYAFEKLRGQS